MTTFIKTKFKILNDQTNIDKSGLSAKITVSYYIKINLATNHYYKKLCGPVSHLIEVNFNIGFGIPIQFQSRKRKKNQIGP